MTVQEAEALIEKGLSGVHAEVGIIHSAKEYEIANIVRKTTMKLSTYFNVMYNDLFRKYKKARKTNDEKMLEYLTVARNMSICSDYYKEEAGLIKIQMDKFSNWMKEHIFDEVSYE